MVKEELVKRSPLRIFDKSLNGELGKGKIGVITSKEGVGKTACLVHIAIDKMLQGKNVVHISFAKKPDNVLNWYENIFSEVAKSKHLEHAFEVHDELVHKRVVMSFPQGGVPVPSVLNSVKTMLTQAHFDADVVIIDSLDFNTVEVKDLAAIKEFAESINLEVWVSVSLTGEPPLWDENDIPFIIKPYLPEIDIVVNVQFEEDHISLKLVKNREAIVAKNLALRLDPKTLLIETL